MRYWYKATYPDDTEIKYMRRGITFKGLWDVLKNGGSVYGYLGNVDSLIRERVFQELCERFNLQYADVYDLWLKGEN